MLLGIAAAANALPKKELENLTLSHKRDMAELNKRLEVRHHRRIVALQRGSITWAVVAAAAAVVVVVVVAMVAMVVVEAMAMAAVLAGSVLGAPSLSDCESRRTPSRPAGDEGREERRDGPAQAGAAADDGGVVRPRAAMPTAAGREHSRQRRRDDFPGRATPYHRDSEAMRIVPP